MWWRRSARVGDDCRKPFQPTVAVSSFCFPIPRPNTLDITIHLPVSFAPLIDVVTAASAPRLFHRPYPTHAARSRTRLATDQGILQRLDYSHTRPDRKFELVPTTSVALSLQRLSVTIPSIVRRVSPAPVAPFSRFRFYCATSTPPTPRTFDHSLSDLHLFLQSLVPQGCSQTVRIFISFVLLCRCPEPCDVNNSQDTLLDVTAPLRKHHSNVVKSLA
jgi:hypothetical protein